MAKTYDEYMQMASRAHEAGEPEHARQLVLLAKQARSTAEQEARSTAMGGPFVSPEEQARADYEARRDALIEQYTYDPPESWALATLTVGAGVLGWVIARRTLLAARPKLTRRWFGVFGPALWRCGRCGTEVALRAHRCEVCGQEQTWPKWSVRPWGAP
jgi:hypothetical protein